MKRKKIAATLIMVVTICSAILMTGTVLVTMTIGDYKMKQAQSNKIHNLYGADSGLDAAYDVMVADFDVAGNFAGFKVEQLKAKTSECKDNQEKYNNLDEEDRLLESKNPAKELSWYENERKRIQKNKNIVINAEFQRSFKLFLNSEWAKSNKGECVPNQLANINKSKDIDSIEYVAQINKTGTENDKNSVDINNRIKGENLYKKDVLIKGNPEIIINFLEKNLTDDVVEVSTGSTASQDNYKNKQTVKIEITSNFQTKDKEDGEKVVGVNKRTLKASYNLVIPNYDDIYFTDQEYKPFVYDIYKDKGITVFGNMEVKDMGNANFTVGENSDVFVLGNINKPVSTIQTGTGKNVSSGKIIDKYKGGISLESASGGNTQINFNSKVITGGTFNIQKNVDVNIKDELYALNVYAGRQNGEEADHSSLTVGSMIVDNDLTLKATDTQISMDNFYGINDKRVEENNEKARNSSSIIVNTYNDASSVNISKIAYIMGVAYIDTATPFETGESIGVKGNYKAYSGEAKKDKDSNLEFRFGVNAPLYLINGKVVGDNEVSSNVNIFEKSKHFVNYWEEEGNKDKLDNGGVKLPEDIDKIHSVGAIVYSDGTNARVRDGNYGLGSTESEILELRRKYALNVYNLGGNLDAENISKIDDTKSSDDKISSDKKEENKNIEEKNKKLDQLYDVPPSRDAIIASFMTLKNLSEDDMKKPISNDGNTGIFNSYEDKKVIIKGPGAKYEANGDDIVLNATSGKLSAFIATAGDVIIDGSVNFEGNIIAEGNLIVQGSGNKTITYNKEVAESIQRKAQGIFSKVFNSRGRIEDTTTPDVKNLKIDYDLGKFLKNLLWKIMK